MNVQERFEQVSDDYLEFDLVSDKLNKRPDIHAFLLIDELFPCGGRALVSAASHDVIYLDIDGENLMSLTDSHILQLTRCGVRYDQSNDCLSMFV